jgi:2-polyprenyl-3-methyl-5-hydroxy-6-metoxy-1,4-benzoquinol methylase
MHAVSEENNMAKKAVLPRCRFCGAKLHYTFVDLGMQPLCESYIGPEGLNQMEPFYPLHVHVCHRCFLVQLEEYVAPKAIFGEYAYFSSYSETWLSHAENYVTMVSRKFELDKSSLVVEIGSNDGYLLQYFAQRGIPVLGVEPAANVAEAAIKKGIPTVVKFFSEETANELLTEKKQADLLIGNNVLAQVPDLDGFIQGIKVLLKPQGIITMEFPHLAKLIDGNQLDTIYHEHFSYFSFMTTEKIFASHGLTIFDVEELPTHGGSLRIFARHDENKSFPITRHINELRDREKREGFADLNKYLLFGEKAKETKRKLLSLLISLKRKKKSIAGYGAPGKGNTLLNYCGIRTDFLEYTVDRNPYKQGKFLPGTHIPIFHPDKIIETKPDYLLILPWNIKDEIIRQMCHIGSWDGRFIVPIPEATVYDAKGTQISNNDI